VEESILNFESCKRIFHQNIGKVETEEKLLHRFVMLFVEKMGEGERKKSMYF